jgi:putative oxidoreductase
VQRLFSSFADGWPGAGLLLIRLVTGGGLLYNGILSTVSAPDLPNAGIATLAAATGAFLVVGLCTPVTGIAIAALEVWIALSHPGYRWNHLVPGSMGLSLAMIGPGAWSIDARLFGRKQMDLSRFEKERRPPQN